MDDKDILARIDEYVVEERRLRERYQRGELDREEEHRRLERLEVALDQCWDLLRRRRARLEAGEDPGGAEARPPDEVEGYLQ
ncbi:DUF2630 family protein [Actinomadura mexicana]|uniref:DUF2630 domain-containing protein n=1 Tax=Actinomadura mexicana TaxID=134959 RepID=A0A238WMH8_9ACTN|nr:DUF2630 family protein [Actinomadura mexicana]SNR47780.1 Protein of unknown function [Actinomadura mexicana]